MSLEKLREIASMYQEDIALLEYSKDISRDIFNEELSKYTKKIPTYITHHIILTTSFIAFHHFIFQL